MQPTELENIKLGNFSHTNITPYLPSNDLISIVE